ncbi:MAG TPA: hypothetical protein DD473_28495 [Planctomycetaceae bacterium]|nr:hypothetical protein [Planctomycetaceae bacterium]|tara:strand:- start:1676 stop:3316 length:1641 start_codon:yes stop_codon:yes gene_type:complete
MAKLETIAGPNAGDTYPIRNTGVTIVGRDETCDIVLAYRSISRHHAQFICEGDDYFLEDMGSVNGTFVNGEKVTDRVRLYDGHRINFYEIPLIFRGDNYVADSNSHETAEIEETSYELDVMQDHSQLSMNSITQQKRRLKYLLAINSKLAGSLDIDEILPKVLDILFEIFPQSINGHIMLLDEDKKLIPRAFKQGRDDDSSVLTMIPSNSKLAPEVIRMKQGVLRDSDEVSESVLDEPVCSTMCVPLLSPNKKPLGAIELETAEEINRFLDEDLEVLSSVADMTGLAIAYAKAHTESLARQKHLQQMEMAHEVQMKMLPRNRPDSNEYDFADFYCAAEQVGGDFFYYRWLSSKRLVIALGDICGKGMPAALKMAQMTVRLHHIMETAKSLKSAMQRLNAASFTDIEELDISMTTLVVCVLNIQDHTLSIANAGHIPPICVMSENQKLVHLTHAGDGLPLGVAIDADYHPATYKINPGDVVLLCTDGATEAMDTHGDLYGIEGICQSIKKSEPSAQSVVNQIVKDVRTFSIGQARQDDMCILAFGRK